MPAIHGKGTTRRRLRGPAAIIALLALAALASGCGGSSDSGAETALRKKLQAGAAKLTDAKSFRVEVPIEAEMEGEVEELGCIKLGLESRGKVERFDLLFFDLNCSGGSEAHELIAVGHHAWASSSDQPGSWTAATITPAVLDEIDSEQTDLKGLFEAAENIGSDPEGGAVDEGDGNFVEVPVYDFEAPASAFAGSDDLGDTEIEFEAVLDRKGFLRELTVHGSEDGVGATISDKYEEIDQDLGIRPPDPSEVHGKVAQVRSKDDLDRLFGFPSS